MGMVLPMNYAEIEQEEMMYLDGGAVNTITGTAKYLKGQASALMASWTALAGGYTYGTAVTAASGIGVGVSVIAGISAGYCAFAAGQYRSAFNYFSLKSQSSSKRYKMQTISFLGVLTGVSYGVA